MPLSKAFLTYFLKILSLFPLRLLHLLGSFLACFLYLLPNRLKATTLINLKLCFSQKSDKEIKKLTRLSLSETSKAFFESGKNWVTYPTRNINSIIEVEGLNYLNRSLDLKRGVILFTPHLGNIEVIIKYLSSNFTCTFPYSEIKISTAESFIKTARESMGATMVNTSISGVRKLIDSLNNGKIIAIACDQVPAIKSGIHSNFFGVKALTMTLVVRLALKTKSPCHSISCIRKKNGKGFQIYFSNAINKLNFLDVQEGVNHMNSQMEKCIMRAPEQYAWEYKRFKKSLFKSPY